MLRPDCGSLVEDYEAVRQEALECGGRAVHGRALLRFKGMAAWMKGVAEAPRRVVPVTPPEGLRLPAGIEENLIHILATMTLTTALEGMA